MAQAPWWNLLSEVRREEKEGRKGGRECVQTILNIFRLSFYPRISYLSSLPIRSQPTAVPSLVSLSLLLLDYLARHEALRPHEEDIYVLEAKRQLTWVLKQAPPSLDAAWHLWLGVRLEKLRAFARSEKARVYRKQFPQEFSPLPFYPNTEPVPPPPPSEAATRLASMAFSPSSSPSPSPSHTGGPAHFNAPPPPPPHPVVLAPPRLLGLPPSSSSILSSLTPSYLLELEGALPPQHRDYAWRLLYSLAGNGASLTTFFKKVREQREGGREEWFVRHAAACNLFFSS